MTWTRELDEQVRAYLPELRLAAEEPMARHTSFRIGGPARRMAFPARPEQVVVLTDLARKCGARPLVIGRGTNLLVPDEGLDRLVIDLSDGLTRLEPGAEPGGIPTGGAEPGETAAGEEETGGAETLRAEAGVPLSRLADLAQKRGLTGLEFAHGIPGTVGGAMCMNAGAYGGEMSQVTERVTVLDPESGIKSLSRAEMAFGYRRSVLTDHPEWVVLSAVFSPAPGDPAAIRAKMEELMTRRRAAQPLEFPSAGSTFKRPEGGFAGTLIEQCGLKGLTVGGAQVSGKHAGFLINRGGATCADVLELIRQVRETVYERRGVRLEPEVRVVK